MSAIFAREELNKSLCSKGISCGQNLANRACVCCDFRLVLEPLKHKSAQTELLEIPYTGFWMVF